MSWLFWLLFALSGAMLCGFVLFIPIGLWLTFRRGGMWDTLRELRRLK